MEAFSSDEHELPTHSGRSGLAKGQRQLSEWTGLRSFESGWRIVEPGSPADSWIEVVQRVMPSRRRVDLEPIPIRPGAHPNALPKEPRKGAGVVVANLAAYSLHAQITRLE